jgi:thiamine-phosphate pyrophosphorylase
MPPPLLYYITDRTAFPGDELTRQKRLLEKIREAAKAQLDYIQLREKDLPAHDLELLARKALKIIHESKPRTENREPGTKLLINSRTDVALATGAHGVHLPAHDLSPADVRRICERAAGTPARIRISIACHNPKDVAQAAQHGAGLALFAPVFEKKDRPASTPTGLKALREACQYRIPVLALGGITLDNAPACLAAGAAGIAAIRLFQDHNIPEVAKHLRSL